MIPYGRQQIDAADVEAVVSALRSDFLTQGPLVPAFEGAVAAYCGAKQAVAVSSATSALHLACAALGVGKGDWVWTTPITFVASANCALYCGGRVDFVDINPRTFNLCVERLADKLKLARAKGTLPKVVIPVHLCGQSCDMAGLHALSLEYGFKIIEDASHAIGGKYKGVPVGRGQYSDITIFSFHPVKIITTGEGGMALTNDPKLAGRMARLRSHGITRDEKDMQQRPDGPWYYEQIELGFNYRLTELQAALGLSQIRHLDEFVAKRHALAAVYNNLLQDTSLGLPWQHPDCYSGMHLYVVRVPQAAGSSARLETFRRLRRAEIGVNLHYIPIYRQPYYRQFGYSPQDFPEAERYYAEAITLPLFPGLTEVDQRRVVEALRESRT